jgi:hypothetical protein
MTGNGLHPSKDNLTALTSRPLATRVERLDPQMWMLTALTHALTHHVILLPALGSINPTRPFVELKFSSNASGRSA